MHVTIQRIAADCVRGIGWINKNHRHIPFLAFIMSEGNKLKSGV